MSLALSSLSFGAQGQGIPGLNLASLEAGSGSDNDAQIQSVQGT